MDKYPDISSYFQLSVIGWANSYFSANTHGEIEDQVSRVNTHTTSCTVLHHTNDTSGFNASHHQHPTGIWVNHNNLIIHNNLGGDQELDWVNDDSNNNDSDADNKGNLKDEDTG